MTRLRLRQWAGPTEDRSLRRSNPERALALTYAPAARRAGLAALLDLDDLLAGVVRTTREPLIGQMRLTWWHEALSALDVAPPPAQPVLEALAAEVLPQGVTGARLAAMIDGWELLLDAEPLDAVAFAAIRGGGLFAAAAVVLGGEDKRLATLGEGWALADLAGRLTDRETAVAAGGMAGERLGVCFGRPWPAPLRPLGALGLLARFDLAGEKGGALWRTGRLLLHRVTGR